MNQQELDALGDGWIKAMRRGDFAQAWQYTDRVEHERRAQEAAGTLQWKPYHLLWNGKPLQKRNVLVWCNHGLGDAVQFMRYVPHVRAIASNVTVLIAPPLIDLFAGCAGFGDVLNGWTDKPPPAHDVEIEIMELPYAFRSTIETLPRSVPYLPMTRILAHAPALPPFPEDDALRIGLVWGASDWDTTRSIPVRTLAPLGQLASVHFYSLQQGYPAQQWREVGVPLEPLSAHTGEIIALAAAMQKLDLIITVDCMVAHLAGALARPVWVLLQREADWRWMRERSDSPWYPTMRLFRQPSHDDWDSVVEAVKHALVNCTSRDRSALAPGAK